MPLGVQLIFNPLAGRGRARMAAKELQLIAPRFGAQVTWNETTRPAHAVELASQAAREGYEKVIALGGDGTVHEVINGLMAVPAARRPILGVVPIGSGNDFAYALQVPTRPDRALAFALNGPVGIVDIGQLSDAQGGQKYFGNTVGIGFDATVAIRSRRRSLAPVCGKDLIAVIQTMVLNYEPAKVTHEADSETWQDETLMTVLGNGPREGGGFLMAPGARNDDGVLDFGTVQNISRLRMFRLVPEFLPGTHLRFAEIRRGSCRRSKMLSHRPFCIHGDGEIFATLTLNFYRVR